MSPSLGRPVKRRRTPFVLILHFLFLSLTFIATFKESDNYKLPEFVCDTRHWQSNLVVDYVVRF